ncbi:MAG: nuclear transport factor 2 family protein [Gammaproteobacteria bacterium]|nr:nuclear transport factor 2 family protein [Gammaproteobacteria bacterium]
MAAYRNGNMRITTHETETFHIRHVSATLFIVALRVQLAGHYAGTPFKNIAYYTRVWSCSESGQWQIVGGHVSLCPVRQLNNLVAAHIFIIFCKLSFRSILN